MVMDLIHSLMFNNRILSLLEVNDKESIQQARFKIHEEKQLIKDKLKNRHKIDVDKILMQCMENNKIFNIINED